MIICIPGEYYVYETEQFPVREELINFFQDLNENDVLEIRLKISEDDTPQIFHVNQFMLENHLPFTNLAIEKAQSHLKLLPRNVLMMFQRQY